jgi:RNA polymerase sigma-70 factor, ECF subfamily
MSADDTDPGCEEGGEDRDSRAPAPGEVTSLLERWARGDKEAYARLMPVVYDELRRLASRQMAGERGDHTLQTTALVHEAYLRLAREGPRPWANRRHFFALAARAMRQILVEHARRVRAGRRGSGLVRVELGEADAATEIAAEEVLAVNAALERLATLDPRQERIVELRYFAGQTVPEVASSLGVSASTVEREWRAARAWLQRELEGPGAAPA